MKIKRNIIIINLHLKNESINYCNIKICHIKNYFLAFTQPSKFIYQKRYKFILLRQKNIREKYTSELT